MRIVSFLLLLAVAGCGTSTKGREKPFQPAQDVVAGAARVRGGGVVMDVQIGRAPLTQPVANETVKALPNAAVMR